MHSITQSLPFLTLLLLNYLFIPYLKYTLISDDFCAVDNSYIGFMYDLELHAGHADSVHVVPETDVRIIRILVTHSSQRHSASTWQDWKTINKGSPFSKF